MNIPSTLILGLTAMIAANLSAAEPPSSQPPAARPAEDEGVRALSAQGNEPGWTLEIADQRIRLRLDYGTRTIDARLPPPEQLDGATVYDLADPGIRVRIDSESCRDDMTGMPYPLQVTLTEGDRVLRGCGGNPRDLLDGEEWTVTSIAGEPVPDDLALTIAFRKDDDRFFGSAGCNRMMGQYELTGEGLSFGRIATTMMACPEPQMAIEQRFVGTLEEVIRFEVSPAGELVLSTADDSQIKALR